MNHCGQSPRRLILLREDDPQDLLDRRVMLERQQKLDRPLADIAGSPGGAGILFEPVRHGQMDHGIVGEPREQRVERRALGAAARDAKVAGDAFPVACGRRQKLPVIVAMPIFPGKFFRRGWIGHRTGDGETEFVHGPCAKSHIAPMGVMSRLPIKVEQFVATDRLDRIRRAGREMIDGVGIMLAPKRLWVGAEWRIAWRRESTSIRPAWSSSRSPSTKWPKTRKRQGSPSTVTRHCIAGSSPDAMA